MPREPPSNRAGASARRRFEHQRARTRLGRAVAVALLVGAGGLALAGSPRRPARWPGRRSAWASSSPFRGGGRDPQRWRIGAEGEEATAALLTRLGRRRWVCYHDIRLPGARANVDHLIIGRSGVWVIDSKTTRVGVRSRRRRVWLGERRLDVGPLRWEAGIVADRLGIEVRPLVVIHGADRGLGRPGLPARGRRVDGVPVVDSARLLRRLRRGRRRLRPHEVHTVGERARRVLPLSGGRGEG